MVKTTPKQISETIVESLADTSCQVDSESFVIRGVKLIGFESRNGRSYPPSTLKAAVQHYENTPVNLDHPAKPTDSRSVRDRIGVIRSARFIEGRGVFGDFHFNPKHEAAEQIVWDATNNPSIVGFSHNASLHIARKGGKSVVESIAGVRSMDLVADPATTSGFFESVTDDASATEGVSDDITDSDSFTEGETVKLEELTLEQIVEGRDDVKALVVKSEQLEAITAERDQLKAEKRQLEFAAAVESELAASKLTAEQVSDAFRKTLLATESADDREALIADRESCFEGQTTPPPKKKPATTPVTEGQGEPLTAQDLVRALRSR